MGIKINTNTALLNAQRQTGIQSRQLDKTQQKLASGLRINSAADDAAGLASADEFRTQIRQYTQEVGNLQTGVNVVQTAGQALGTQQEGIGRIQELATQAANGTLTADQRTALNQEAQQILQQMDQTAQNTEFNGQKLLTGTGPIPVRTEGGEQIAINASTTTALGLNGLDLGTQEGAAAALDRLSTASNRIDENRASLGAQENRFGSAIETRQIAATNLAESESRIRDLDVAQGVMAENRAQILQHTGLAAMTQGNMVPQAAAQLLGIR